MSSASDNCGRSVDLTAMMMSRLHIEYLEQIPDTTIPKVLLESEGQKFEFVCEEINRCLSVSSASSVSDAMDILHFTTSVPSDAQGISDIMEKTDTLKNSICDTLVMNVSAISVYKYLLSV